VSKEFFEALLETFAREAEAGLARIIVLVLDNAGWHGAANLKIPDGIRLIYLPPYSPELQPAETLWALVDEPIVNKHIATIEELDTKIASQCVALAEQREQIRTRTGFHWWPKPINPNYVITRKPYHFPPDQFEDVSYGARVARFADIRQSD
jgi:transposase